MLSFLMEMFVGFASLCCTLTPDGGLACHNAKLQGACEWTAICEAVIQEPFPVCDGTEVFAGLDLRCCSYDDAVAGHPLHGCSTPGTALGLLPWCGAVALDGLVSCPLGWVDDGMGSWACPG